MKTLLLNIMISLLAVQVSSVPVEICNSDLLFSYGIQNPQYLNQTSLFCQNGSPETCCSNNDQSYVLEKWNEQNRKTIQPFYESTQWLIKSIFQFYEDVILSAKYMYLNPKTETSCRESAEFLIMNYIDRKEVRNFVKNLQDTNNFFSEIRRGFFCSICSVKNQKYFNTDLKKVVFSYEACDDLVIYSIETIAARVNKIMPVLANINAVMNCQFKDEPDDQELFTMKADKFYNVNKCFSSYEKNKKTGNFFEHCSDFCTDFSLVAPSESFEGMLKPLFTLKNKLLKTKIIPTDPFFDDIDYQETYNFGEINDEFFVSDLSFQDLGKYETMFGNYGLVPLDASETALFFYGPESTMEILAMTGLLVQVSVVIIFGWLFN